MASYVLHPLFQGRAIRVDIPTSENEKAHDGTKAEPIRPLSALPADKVEKLVDEVRRNGGRLNDSWDCV